MRRRPLVLSSFVVLALALGIGIDAAVAAGMGQGPRWVMSAGVIVHTSGTGSGTVSSAPGGIDCGPKCASQYPWHTQVTLTATPAVGSIFAGWSGACTGTGACKVTAGCGGAACSWTAVTATFTLISDLPNTLSISINGTGYGTVSSTPAGIACPASCVSEYPLGTQVTLSATPYNESTFTGWSGACTGTGTCEVTIGSQTGVAVTATFALIPCSVPRLKGKTLAAAERSINSHDCSVGRITHQPSRRVRRGHVLSQAPKAGAQRTQGENVDLVVSKGRR